MASPKMLVQRAEQANLQPRAFYLNRPPKPKTMMRGDYASLLRACAVNANEAMHRRVAAGNEGRDIPTGGSGRRRAKAHRQRGLCMADGATCRRSATAYFGRCWTHLTPEFLRSRGQHRLAALVEAGGRLTRGRQYEGDTLQADGALATLVQPESWTDVTGEMARLLGEWRDSNEATA
jgi:hypothetical protein